MVLIKVQANWNVLDERKAVSDTLLLVSICR